MEQQAEEFALDSLYRFHRNSYNRTCTKSDIKGIISNFSSFFSCLFNITTYKILNLCTSEVPRGVPHGSGKVLWPLLISVKSSELYNCWCPFVTVGNICAKRATFPCSWRHELQVPKGIWILESHHKAKATLYSDAPSLSPCPSVSWTPRSHHLPVEAASSIFFCIPFLSLGKTFIRQSSTYPTSLTELNWYLA